MCPEYVYVNEVAGVLSPKKIKHYLRRANKVNRKKVLLCFETMRYMQIHMNKHIINIEKMVLHYVKLTSPLSFQTGFHKIDQPIGGKW